MHPQISLFHLRQLQQRWTSFNSTDSTKEALYSARQNVILSITLEVSTISLPTGLSMLANVPRLAPTGHEISSNLLTMSGGNERKRGHGVPKPNEKLGLQNVSRSEAIICSQSRSDTPMLLGCGPEC